MILWREIFRRIRGLYLIILLFSLINLSVCIYEDQIGKFDWRQTYVGRIKFARLDTVNVARRIIVATEENVIAALNFKTGEIVWRHVLESAGAGEIQFLHVGDKATLTVTGDNPYIVRGWDTISGLLLWEWTISLNAQNAEESQWVFHQGQLTHILPVPESHIEISSYRINTGQNRGQSLRISAPWVNKDCVLSGSHFTCISGNYGSKFVFTIDVSLEDPSVQTKPLSSFVDWATSQGKLRPLDGISAKPGYVIDTSLVTVEGSELKVAPVNIEDGASATVVESTLGLIVLQLHNNGGKQQVSAHRLSNGELIPEMSYSTKLSYRSGVIEVALCAKEHTACRLLVSNNDDSITFTRQGEVLWNREEALANIVAVEFVDLPVSDLDAAIESEFDHVAGDVWGAFTRRIHSQIQQLTTTIQALVKMATKSEAGGAGADERAPLVRDDLDLHKIIVAVTRVGKVFGIDNLSGEVIWSQTIPDLSCDHVSLFLQRSARHPPHDSVLTIVAKSQSTSNGLVASVNPVTGALSPAGVLPLDRRLRQAALLPMEDTQRMRGVVLLDEDNSVQVLPLSSASLVQDFYMFVANKETTKVQGYALKYDGRQVEAVETWSLTLGGSADSGHRIVSAVTKSPQGRVHSHGKVMGDRSVLYKYINPNLVLFITEGPDPVHKDVVHMFLVDGVSGALVAAHAHRRAHAMPHAVHADNLAAYAYYNDKYRRTEIASVELYEGARRSLAPGAAFSSLGRQPAPLVTRQTFILPAALAALADTVTERGITDKHLLLSLSNGLIMELPWAYLDPRRPSALTAEQREEGLLQYAPELPLPAEAAVNYNRTLSGTRAVRTSTAGLESTCLVFAYGLDLFYTRVAPSRTFDLLKDDFDYYLIVLVLGALLVATYATKYFASRKMLRQAWK